MGQQLDELAASAARLLERPLHQLLADAAAAPIGGHAHILDQAARSALRAQARQDAELQAADNIAALLRHDKLDIRIALHALERVVIELWQRLLEPLTRAAQMIVGKHGDDGGDI